MRQSLTFVPIRLTHFTDPAARQLVSAARQADEDADEEPKGKGKAKSPAKKGKPTPPKKVKKEESDDKSEYPSENEDEEEDFEDFLIRSKQNWERKDRDRKSGGESSKRR